MEAGAVTASVVGTQNDCVEAETWDCVWPAKECEEESRSIG